MVNRPDASARCSILRLSRTTDGAGNEPRDDGDEDRHNDRDVCLPTLSAGHLPILKFDRGCKVTTHQLRFERGTYAAGIRRKNMTANE